MGWPDEASEDYQRYFPTSTLVTGYDIIAFWVSRMIFQSLEFTGERPFQNVLIHGLIRDEQGRKMSKSLGNGIDPMDVIENMAQMRYVGSYQMVQHLVKMFVLVMKKWMLLGTLSIRSGMQVASLS